MPSSEERTATTTDVRELTAAALLAALLAAAAWVTIPIGAVPITLQVFVVVLASLVLRPGAAFAVVGVYVLLGATGVPVFSGPAGGLGVLAGPTGGYLVGFAVGAPAGALVRWELRRVRAVYADLPAAVVVIVCIYVFGWAQLAFVTGIGGAAAFAAGVAPFILLDAFKAAVAIAIAGVLRRTGAV